MLTLKYSLALPPNKSMMKMTVPLNIQLNSKKKVIDLFKRESVSNLL